MPHDSGFVFKYLNQKDHRLSSLPIIIEMRAQMETLAGLGGALRPPDKRDSSAQKVTCVGYRKSEAHIGRRDEPTFA